MKVYMLHSADARKAAKDVRRFDMSGGKLLLFREPGDDGDYEGLKNAFGSSEVYECPGAEHVLMADTLKAAVSHKDSLYLIGPALTGFFEASRDRVLDMASAVYVSKTLNTEGKRPVQKKKRKREVPDASDVLSELLALNLCQAEKETQEPPRQDAPQRQPPRMAEQEPARSDRQKGKVTPHQAAPQKRMQKQRQATPQKQQGGGRGCASDGTADYGKSPVEDAKGSLCAGILERMHRHIADLCFKENKDMAPVSQGDVVPFVILLLRSYARALERERAAVGGHALASELDYGKIYTDTIEMFETSWAATHSIIRITKDVLSVLLPEAQYYWRLTKMLYEEDLWENM